MWSTDDSCRAPPRNPPAAVQTVFIAVSPLLKGVEAGAAKRTRLEEYLGVRLGEGVQTRARCRNVTKWDVSPVTNVGFMFLGDSMADSTLVHSGLEFRFGLWCERCSSQGQKIGLELGLLIRMHKHNQLDSQLSNIECE